MAIPKFRDANFAIGHYNLFVNGEFENGGPLRATAPPSFSIETSIEQLISYDFDQANREASFLGSLISDSSEVLSRSSGIYPGEFGVSKTIEDSQEGTFNVLIWSARSVNDTNNTFLEFSITPKSNELIKVDSIYLDLGVKSNISGNTPIEYRITSYRYELRTSADNFSSVVADSVDTPILQGNGFALERNHKMTLMEEMLIGEQTTFRLIIKRGENGANNGYYTQRAGFLSGLKIFGKSVKNHSAFIGTVDDIGIFGRALIPAEITSNYQYEKDGLSPFNSNPEAQSSGQKDFFVTRFSKEGVISKSLIGSGPGIDSVNGLAGGPREDFYLTGSFGTSLSLGDLNASGEGMFSNAFLAKLDQDLNPVWLKSVGGGGLNRGEAVTVSDNGTAFLRVASPVPPSLTRNP